MYLYDQWAVDTVNVIVAVRYAEIDIEALIKYINNYCNIPRILTRIDRIRRINILTEFFE